VDQLRFVRRDFGRDGLDFNREDPLPKARERLFNACEHVFTMTAGAFIGLLGGRASIPDPKQK